MDDLSQNPKLGSADRPNSYIGRSIPRERARKLLNGKGRYVDDILLPRMVHLNFIRSPFSHAKIKSINIENAKMQKGVLGVFTIKDIEKVCTPWKGVLGHLGEMISPTQYALANDVARWQGEPIVVVAANNRNIAEDASELVEIDYEELPAQLDMENALEKDSIVIHDDLKNNLPKFLLRKRLSSLPH